MPFTAARGGAKADGPVEVAGFAGVEEPAGRCCAAEPTERGGEAGVPGEELGSSSMKAPPGKRLGVDPPGAAGQVLGRTDPCNADVEATARSCWAGEAAET